ncbi:MAG TPA: thioredoxin domain-containing protein [Candidatus Saccharimonadales bacterium]|nr:thioredoxin domain-containing protein [Candidatus Saccharimonadales bacterium]
MDKRFWGIILAIILIFGGIVYMNNRSNSNTAASPSHHVEGNNKKNVTLLEYGDYQCPACESYYPIVKQVVAKYNDDITFQFRNLPLTQLHQNAFVGARAAEAAALQNKFWEMHDMLYDNQDAWSESSDPASYFYKYATELGMNLDQFKKDYASSKVNDTINADIAAFNKTGATMATPTFFLDGKKIDTTATVDSFAKQIDAAIASKN